MSGCYLCVYGAGEYHAPFCPLRPPTPDPDPQPPPTIDTVGDLIDWLEEHAEPDMRISTSSYEDARLTLAPQIIDGEVKL